MQQVAIYPIGTPGKPWENEEKQTWLKQQTIKRSYYEEVITKIDSLDDDFERIEYGMLNYEHGNYPLIAIKAPGWLDGKPLVLVTGGVHGYETSGVQGALAFLNTRARLYADLFNLLVLPCVSPWGYETINRWNPNAVDPNRSFTQNSPAEESAAVIALLETLTVSPVAHIDLHETTDTDNSEFRPALAARNGTTNTNWNIPDGFYLVADTEKPEPEFQRAIIEQVAKVTQIAPDTDGKLIGEPVTDFGVIGYEAKKLGLCMGVSDAKWVTTTEVYPDSPNTTPDECILAQVAAVTGALDFIKTRL